MISIQMASRLGKTFPNSHLNSLRHLTLDNEDFKPRNFILAPLSDNFDYYNSTRFYKMFRSFTRSKTNLRLDRHSLLRCKGGAIEADILLVAGPLISACHDARSKMQNAQNRQIVNQAYSSIESRQNSAQPQVPGAPFPPHPLHEYFENKKSLLSGSSEFQSDLHLAPKPNEYYGVPIDPFLKSTVAGQYAFHANETDAVLPSTSVPNRTSGVSIFGRSRSGDLIPIEIIDDNASSAMEINNSPMPFGLSSNNATEANEKEEILAQLQNIAKEFPSCAKYLMGELDKRRSEAIDVFVMCRQRN